MELNIADSKRFMYLNLQKLKLEYNCNFESDESTDNFFNKVFVETIKNTFMIIITRYNNELY